jgi:hypothetical protein
MRSLRFVPLLLAAACGGPDFGGTYDGSFGGVPVTFVLKVADGDLQGTATMQGVEAPVAGTVDGRRASGAVRHMLLPGGELRFEATLRACEEIQLASAGCGCAWLRGAS